MLKTGAKTYLLLEELTNACVGANLTLLGEEEDELMQTFEMAKKNFCSMALRGEALKFPKKLQ